MKTKLTKIAAVALLVAGACMAQGPATRPRAGRPNAQRGAHLQQVAAQLNLTDDQKAQAKEIFAAAKEANAPLRQQMRDARKQLAGDVKSGASQDQIAKDSSQVGVVAGQLAGARAQTMQKFYNILTPDQKTKLETLRANRRTRTAG